MARTSTTNYKHYTKSQRQMTVESGYALGMKYSDAPLDDGFVKTLVNYDYSEQGMKLKPRGGMQPVATLELLTLAENSQYQCLWAGEMYVKVGTDAVLTRAQIIGYKTGTDWLAKDVKVIFENPTTGLFEIGTASVAPGNTLALREPDLPALQMHDLVLQDPQQRCMSAICDSTLFLAYKDGTCFGLMKFEATYATSAYTYVFTKLEGREITPYEAINYGYNMLDDDPYVFSNIAGSQLKLNGILPYDSNNVLKLSANVGEKITFKLIYEYPSAEIKHYKVQWEFNDLSTDRVPMVALTAAKSPSYHPGDAISLSKEPPYKRFSLTAKVYYEDDLTTPLEVILLNAYTVSDDSTDNSLKKTTPTNYAVSKPGGMCAWGGRAIVWGVAGARNIVFCSDVNTPSYFPFPQLSIPCTENVQTCVPYMGDMLIFTDTKLLRATIVGGAIITTVIQENLNFRGWDSHSILTVKNMVYFKTNNYFYMVVPVLNQKGVQELRMAPISQPIEQLLDNFTVSMKEILSEMYDIEFPLMSPQGDWTFQVNSFQNWLDNTTVHNSYLCQLGSASLNKTIHLEVNLKYDTMLRNWAMDITQTNERPRSVYRRIVTESAMYTNLYTSGGKLRVQIMQSNPKDAEDTSNLNNGEVRLCPNYQLIDTGKRAHDPSHKKRFREIQFNLNNVSKEDLFFRDGFIIDDDPRKDLFVYSVEHITDKQDPNYGMIFVDRVPTDLLEISGATKLGSWRLGISQLPEVSIIRTRVAVSGKGFNGRYKLLSVNSAMYELLSISWVYRMMNAR